MLRAISLLALASEVNGQNEIPATPQNPQAAGAAGANPMGGMPNPMGGALSRQLPAACSLPTRASPAPPQECQAA